MSKERNMFVTERFLSEVVEEYGIHSVSTTDGGTVIHKLQVFKLFHHIHSHYEKSIIERTIQYIKDRTYCFDDYFPCRKNKYKLNHIKQWFFKESKSVKGRKRT